MPKIGSLASRQFERVLLIKPSAFGDVLHTLPVLVKLRARYPGARIDWLITPENAELVRYHPALSNVVLFARRDYARWNRMLAAGVGLLRLVNTLQSAQFDVVIDLHGQFRSAFFALASGAPVRIGFDRPIPPRGKFQEPRTKFQEPTTPLDDTDRLRIWNLVLGSWFLR